MKNRWVFALSMAFLWGIIFANALNDVTIGICMGLLMGMAFGLFDNAKDADCTNENGIQHEDIGSER